MRYDENKIIIASVMFSFILHILLVNFLPGIKGEIPVYEEEEEVISVLTNFVNIRDTRVESEIESRKAPQEEKVIVEEETGAASSLVEVEMKTPQGVIDETVNLLPEIKAPNIQIREERVNRTVDIPARTKEIIRYDNIDEREDIKGIDQELTERSFDYNFGEIVKRPIEFDSLDAIESDTIIPLVGDYTEGGLTPVDLPEGIVIDRIIGTEGLVYWDENNVMPIYPEIAEKNGWQGSVTLRINVDQNGDVVSSSVFRKSAYSILDIAAKSESQKWKMLIVNNGVSVSGTVQITINFKL